MFLSIFPLNLNGRPSTLSGPAPWPRDSAPSSCVRDPRNGGGQGETRTRRAGRGRASSPSLGTCAAPRGRPPTRGSGRPPPQVSRCCGPARGAAAGRPPRVTKAEAGGGGRGGGGGDRGGGAGGRAAGERGAAPARAVLCVEAEGRRRGGGGGAWACAGRACPGGRPAPRRPRSAPPPGARPASRARWQPRRPSTLRVSSGRGPRRNPRALPGDGTGRRGWARRAPPGTRRRGARHPHPRVG